MSRRSQSPPHRCAPLLLSALLPLTVSCYRTEACPDEVCDGIDNDCDGVADEGFVDGKGRYREKAHCGRCDLHCDAVFPSADSTRCDAEQDPPRCVIESCPPGQRLLEGACVEQMPVACLPCEADADCELRAEGARCLEGLTGEAAGYGHCGAPCERAEDCPSGFRCLAEGGAPAQCRPSTRSCACSEELFGAEIACLLQASDAHACAGVRHCEEGGFGPCIAALGERCNGIDDDCDDAIDEDFRDAQGLLTSTEHCGDCDSPCVPPGEHTEAQCLVEGRTPRCEVRCEPGFVDVDGQLLTGCECELDPGPGAVIGADADCDGQIDPTPDFIFVAPTGDDENAGTEVQAPLRTIQKGIELGQSSGHAVLVARGIYDGPVDLRGGVTLLGGYSPDFRERDWVLHPVLIENLDAPGGTPMLRCRDIDAQVLMEGFTIAASEADAPGAGSTGVYLDRCSEEVVLRELTVLAARGADGQGGADSSARLSRLGLASLGQLRGSDGTDGGDGDGPGSPCLAVTAGAGGQKSCPGGAVSGGDGGDALCPDLSAICDNASAAPCGNGGCTDFTVDGVCDIEAARAAALPSSSLPSAGSGDGGGSAGHLTYASPTNRDQCSFCDDNPSLSRNGARGGDGAQGADGSAGLACDGEEELDLDGGRLRGGDGSDGTDGGDGSGGGGASAGAGYAVIANTLGSCDDNSGGSGGGGGSGGCGAPGSGGGGGGGSSVGLLIRLIDGAAAGPQLERVRVVTASGGDGGDGGIAAAGGSGGSGGIGGEANFWCSRSGGRGGDGGSGGDGGGGGGCGGSSYGVYLVGDNPDYRAALDTGVLVEAAGVAGRQGRGGFSPGHSGPSASAGRVLGVGPVP